MAKAKLAEYKKKRDPKKTPEPFGGSKRGQEHLQVGRRAVRRGLNELAHGVDPRRHFGHVLLVVQ